MTATLKKDQYNTGKQPRIKFWSNHSGLNTSIASDSSFALKIPPFVDAQVIKCIAQGKVTRKEKKMKDDKHNY
jgi:hypothetical protein